MTHYLATHGDTIGVCFLGLVALGLAVWALSGYLRDLKHRAEKKRRREDLASWLAFIAHEQRQADEANFAVAEAFRAAMEQHPSAGDRMARIRAQIKANHEREVAAFRAEIDAWGGGAA